MPQLFGAPEVIQDRRSSICCCESAGPPSGIREPLIDALDTADAADEWPEGGPVISRTRKIDVCWEVDATAFKRLLYRSLA